MRVLLEQVRRQQAEIGPVQVSAAHWYCRPRTFFWLAGDVEQHVVDHDRPDVAAVVALRPGDELRRGDDVGLSPPRPSIPPRRSARSSVARLSMWRMSLTWREARVRVMASLSRVGLETLMLLNEPETEPHSDCGWLVEAANHCRPS
jgi:hypothetical protein